MLSAHCTFNESVFPWKKLPTYEGPTSSDFIDDDLQASMRFPHTRIPVHVQEAPEHERPRRIMTPTAKIIENAAQAAYELDVLGDSTITVDSTSAHYTEKTLYLRYPPARPLVRLRQFFAPNATDARKPGSLSKASA